MSDTPHNNASLIGVLKACLQRPIAFHRIFADLAGGATAGLFLSQAWYWQQRPSDPEGWWYKTQAEWTEETGLTRYEQERARMQLKRVGILEEERRGVPAKLFYRINLDVLHSSMLDPAYWNADSRNLECGFPQSIIETFSETTPERKEDLRSEDPVAKGNETPFATVPVVATNGKPSPLKPKKAPTPLAANDWIWQELQHYRDEFDIDALNDDAWWANLGNSFPDFSRKWVTAAFADLARWLQENPKRLSRTPRGWKQRMSFSLNFYYNKSTRREGYGKATTSLPRH